MNYFGEPWNSTIKNYEQMPTPVGHPCSWCEEKIVAGDLGFLIPQGHVLESGNENNVFDEMLPVFLPVHLACFLRQIFGSVGHQNKKCSCFNGNEEDPPEMTKREAATAAVELYRQRFNP